MTFKKLLEETKDMNLGFSLVILERKLPFSHFAIHETVTVHTPLFREVF